MFKNANRSNLNSELEITKNRIKRAIKESIFHEIRLMDITEERDIKLILEGNKVVALNTLLNADTNIDDRLFSLDALSIDIPLCQSVLDFEQLIARHHDSIPNPINFGLYKSKGSDLKKALSKIQSDIGWIGGNVDDIIEVVENIFKELGLENRADECQKKSARNI